MEPTGWATQIELIWHGAPYSGLRPDARSCRIADVAQPHAYALSCMSLTGGDDHRIRLVVLVQDAPIADSERVSVAMMRLRQRSI